MCKEREKEGLGRPCAHSFRFETVKQMIEDGCLYVMCFKSEVVGAGKSSECRGRRQTKNLRRSSGRGCRGKYLLEAVEGVCGACGERKGSEVC